MQGLAFPRPVLWGLILLIFHVHTFLPLEKIMFCFFLLFVFSVHFQKRKRISIEFVVFILTTLPNKLKKERNYGNYFFREKLLNFNKKKYFLFTVISYIFQECILKYHSNREREENFSGFFMPQEIFFLEI